MLNTAEVIRYLTPVLAGVRGFLDKAEFISNVPEGARCWKSAGMLFPAFYLTALGPDCLIQNGGFIMQWLGIESSFQRVSTMGLTWLVVFLICAWLLDTRRVRQVTAKKLLYGLAYCGLMSSLGVYAFLAMSSQE